jgi:hypothetical protein
VGIRRLLVLERQGSIRLDGVTRFVVFGAAGFGVGGAIAILSMLAPVSLALSVPAGGAAGGASLGLALGDRRRTMILAIMGAVGLTAGIFATLTVGSFFDYSPLLLGALSGAVVGVSLGMAFLHWRTILALGLAGAVGFGIGVLAGDLLRASFPAIRGVGSIVVAGIIGGALLGAALGFLENRRQASRRR